MSQVLVEHCGELKGIEKVCNNLLVVVEERVEVEVGLERSRWGREIVFGLGLGRWRKGGVGRESRMWEWGCSVRKVGRWGRRRWVAEEQGNKLVELEVVDSCCTLQKESEKSHALAIHVCKTINASKLTTSRSSSSTFFQQTLIQPSSFPKFLIHFQQNLFPPFSIF